MSSAMHRARPYRSRAIPACQSCRLRKSRCQLEEDSTTCLMCRLYKTECIFRDTAAAAPPAPGGQGQTTALSRTPLPVQGTTQNDPADVVTVDLSSHTTTRKRRRVVGTPPPEIDNTRPRDIASPAVSGPASGPASGHVAGQVGVTPGSEALPDLGRYNFKVGQPTPMSVYDKDQDNSHIVGPANTNDSQVLTDYLSCVHGTSSGMRLIRMIPTSWSKPVMFTPVQNRTFGKSSTEGLPLEKLNAMEGIIGDHAEPLIDTFFNKVNKCLPLLDHVSFVTQYRNAKQKISPALLACLYAHSITYWASSPQLCNVNPPDRGLLWTLAYDALNAELHTAPSISTIIAILFDLGGRPTTSLIANAVLLGSAVSLAYSLGLNRNPLHWDIPDAEKLLRMKIWWGLIIYDTWLSFSYGTPSHIQQAQSDVPVPETSFFNISDQADESREPTAVFIALARLTDVLDHYLKYLYHIRDDQSNNPDSIRSLELKLNQWVDGLRPDVRRIIIRGRNLKTPGAANLRLSYLSIRFLLSRLKLDQDRERKDTDSTTLENRYMQVQCTAEDIIIFLQELDDSQLNDFWLPMCAFTFTSVTTALLRSAVDTKSSQTNGGQNTSLQLAWDMILALRDFRDRVRWDLGEHCLQQYSSVVEKLIEIPGTGLDSLVFQGLEGASVEDALTFDGEFAGLWDTTLIV